MTALSSTSVTATSAKHHELPRTRLSLYYLAGYTLPVGLALRAFIITALLTLFIQYRDPALLATSTVVTIGWILTFLGWRKDTAEQRG
jgi:uncharacterized membrane protein YGL010W